MLLKITKHTGKAHIISYQRNDGTETWMKADDFFVRHDLSHYAIEKTLGYTSAFMGMLNNGMGIRDFENRDKRLQMTVANEAWYAENMANLFLMEIGQGEELDDFNVVSADAFNKMGKAFPAPVLSGFQIRSIRDCLRDLLHNWDQLPSGQTMQLTFEL